MLVADISCEMGSTLPVYKPRLHQVNGSSSLLVASGREIGSRAGTIPFRGSSPNNNKALPTAPSSLVSARNSSGISEIEEQQTQLEAGSPFRVQNFHLERVEDIPIPTEPESSVYTRLRTAPSTGSSRKIKQLTGFNLNTGDNFPRDNGGDADDEDLQNPNSPTDSTSSGSMYSQPGADYDLAYSGYLGERRLAPRSSGILLQSSIYQSPKQMHMNRQRPRELRHTDRQNRSTKPKHVKSDQPTDYLTEVTILRDIVFREQQRQHLESDSEYSGEERQSVAHPAISELEDTDIGLVPKPLAIRTKKRPNQSPSNFTIFQSAAESWSYGINGLTTANTANCNTSEQSRPSSSNTRCSTPVSPIGSMESDHIILPPLPDTPPTVSRQFGSGKHPLKSPFPFNMKTYEDLDVVLSPKERKPTRRLSGKLTGWPNTKLPIRNKGGRADELSAPVMGKGGFAGPQVLQKRNGPFQEIVEKTRGRMLKKSADERRRESLKGKIVVVGVTDQSPGMSSSS